MLNTIAHKYNLSRLRINFLQERSQRGAYTFHLIEGQAFFVKAGNFLSAYQRFGVRFTDLSGVRDMSNA